MEVAIRIADGWCELYKLADLRKDQEGADSKQKFRKTFRDATCELQEALFINRRNQKCLRTPTHTNSHYHGAGYISVVNTIEVSDAFIVVTTVSHEYLEASPHLLSQEFPGCTLGFRLP